MNATSAPGGNVQPALQPLYAALAQAQPTTGGWRWAFSGPYYAALEPDEAEATVSCWREGAKQPRMVALDARELRGRVWVGEGQVGGTRRRRKHEDGDE